MGAGTDPHLYVAGISDVDKLRGADVIFYNGLYLEAQLEDVLEQLAERPASMEAQRGAVISGLSAIDRLMPELSTWALAAGALQLDQLLASTAGMGTADVRRALKPLEAIT